MLYNLTVNQRAGVEVGGFDEKGIPNIQPTDYFIIEVIRNWMTFDGADRIWHGGEQYIWLSDKLMIDAIPSIPIRSRAGINKRIQKLADVGIIQLHPENQSRRRRYIGAGANWSKLFVHKSDKASTKVDTSVHESRHEASTKVDTYDNNKGDIEIKNIKQAFDIAYSKYPGVKRTNEDEFENFVRKHKKIVSEVAPLLEAAVDNQIQYKEDLRAAEEFCSPWPMFSTWINNKRWGDVIPVRKRMQL